MKDTQKKEHVIWKKEVVAGKRESSLSPVSSRFMILCSCFLNFADPTTSEPRTGQYETLSRVRRFRIGGGGEGGFVRDGDLQTLTP